MVFKNWLGAFAFSLLSSVCCFNCPAKATTYAYTGNTVISGDPAATNSINVTTGGALTVTAGSTFTNNSGATFNNSFLTTVEKGTGASSLYTNYGTSNLGNINLSSSTFNNILNAKLTAGTMTGSNSVFYTNGASSFTNINMSANSSIIVNTSGNIYVGTMNVSGLASLDSSSISLYAPTANINALSLNNHSNMIVGAIANVVSNTVTMSGASTGTNGGKMTFTDFSMGGASTLINNNTMTLGTTTLKDTSTALTNAGYLKSGGLNASNSAKFINNAGKTADITGAATLSNSASITNNGVLNMNTLGMNSASTLGNAAGASLNLSGATSLNAATISNIGNANLKDITALNNSSINNNNSGIFTANTVTTNASHIANTNTMNLGAFNLLAGSGLNNSLNGVLTVSGASVLDASTLSNSKTVTLKDLTAQNGSSIINAANSLFTANNTTAHASTVSNTGTMNLGALNLLTNSTLNNTLNGSLTVSGGSILDASTLNNSKTATLKDLTAQNGSNIINAANATFTANNATISASNVSNASAMNLGTLNLLASSSLTNAATGSLILSGATILDSSTLINSNTATLKDVTAQNTSTITNNLNSTLSSTSMTINAGSNLDNIGTLTTGSLAAVDHSTINNTGLLSSTSTGLSASVLNNSASANLADVVMVSGSSLVNTVNGSLIANNISASASTIENAKTANVNSFNLTSGSTLTNDSTGVLTIATTSTSDASTINNNGTATFLDLGISNGSVLNNVAGTFTTQLLAANASNIINNSILNVDNLSLTNGSTLTNNAADTITVKAGGTTSIDSSKLINKGIAYLENVVLSNAIVSNEASGELTASMMKGSNNSNLTNAGIMTSGMTRFDSGSTLTNNGTLSLTDLNAFIGGNFVNYGNADFNSAELQPTKYTTVADGGTFTNNTGANFTGNGFKFTNGGILSNRGDANLKWISASLNNIITNDVGGTMTITDAALDLNSTLNNASQLDIAGTLYMTNGSTFNGLAGSTTNVVDLTASLESNMNLTQSTLKSTGKITIDAGSTLTSDSELGFNAGVSKIIVSNDIDLFGTFKGSANIDNATSKMVVENGGVIDMLAKDGLALTGDIHFKSGSKYSATIDTLGDTDSADDLQSQIRTNAAYFDDGSIISVGADKRSTDHTKRYAILVATEDHFVDIDDMNHHLELRNSMLTEYGATWVQNDANYDGKNVLYIGITSKPINSLSGLTHNEMEMADLFNTISPRRDLASELNTTLDYLYTQVNDEAELAKIMRSLTLETSANYLNYMPTLHRLMSQGADMRLGSLKNNPYKSNNLWAIPFGSHAKQDHSNDVINRDIQGFDADTYGFSAGFDTTYDNNTVLGGMISYGNVDFEGDYTEDKIKANGVQVGLYASKTIQNWFMDSKISYSHFWNDSETTYLDPVVRTTKADFNTDLYAFDIKGGYTINLGKFNLSPSIGVDVVHARQSSYTESGAGGLSRDIDSANLTSVELPVRMQLDYSKALTQKMAFKPTVYVEYAREVGDVMAEVSSQFINTGTKLDADSIKKDRNRYTVGADLGFAIEPTWEVALRYSGDFRKDFVNTTFMLSTEYKF